MAAFARGPPQAAAARPPFYGGNRRVQAVREGNIAVPICSFAASRAAFTPPPRLRRAASAPGATRCASPRLSAKPALRLWAGPLPPKSSRERDQGPRAILLPCSPAPARSVPLRPAPRSRPCAARAQQKRTAEKFRRPFERALSASQKLSTGCRASDSWCAAGDAPFRCPACPDTPCRAG